MRYLQLFEAGAWAEPYYHGDGQRMEDGISNREMLFLTTDREDAASYGRYVYECELLMQNIADITDKRSKPFKEILLHFAHHDFENARSEPKVPSMSWFLLSHRMWEIDKYLEMDIFRFLFKLGYQVIEFRDTSHDEDKIFNIVAVGRNVKVGKQINADLQNLTASK